MLLNHQMQVVKEQDAVALEELIKELNQMERPVIFLGDAVPVYKELIQESCKVPYSFAPAHLSRQRAGAVGMLGTLYFKEGKQKVQQNISRSIFVFLRQKENVQNV